MYGSWLLSFSKDIVLQEDSISAVDDPKTFKEVSRKKTIFRCQLCYWMVAGLYYLRADMNSMEQG